MSRFVESVRRLGMSEVWEQLSGCERAVLAWAIYHTGFGRSEAVAGDAEIGRATQRTTPSVHWALARLASLRLVAYSSEPRRPLQPHQVLRIRLIRREGGAA